MTCGQARGPWACPLHYTGLPHFSGWARDSARTVPRFSGTMVLGNFIHLQGESIMGKYLLGWLLGVPLIVLVIAYLIFH